MSLKQQLTEGLVGLQLEISEQAQDKLLGYLALLEKWNKHYNLTAIRNIHEMVPLHLLDSLSICPFIHGKNLLDVGTGAGLPGIPLSIVFPEKHFTLLDANAKKIRFCRQAINELKLHNVSAVHERIERFQPEKPLDQITTRAFSDLDKMLKLLQPILTGKTEIVAMKGKLPADEINSIKQQDYKVSEHLLSVPAINAERHLVIIKP